MELGSGIVHASGPFNNEYTLCCLSIDGEGEEERLAFNGDDALFAYEKTTKKITCEHCLAIIRHALLFRSEATPLRRL